MVVLIICLLFWLCLCSLAAVNEIQTGGIVSTLVELNIELKGQRAIDTDGLSRFGQCLKPLRLVLVERPGTADNLTARFFIGYLFNLMEKLSKEAIAAGLSPDLAVEYVVSFAAFMNINENNRSKYANLMRNLGSVIVLSLNHLNECVNWVLLVSRPAIANIPSFLYDMTDSLVPKSLSGDFLRKFARCFGLREGFSHGGYRRAAEAYVPLETVGFILTTAKFHDQIDDTRYMNNEQLCKILKFGLVSDPKDVHRSDPEPFIRTLSYLIWKHLKRREVLEHLLRFIFSTGVVKILAHNYSLHTDAVDELFVAVFQCHVNCGLYGDLIAAEMDKIEPDDYMMFARTLYLVTFSLRTSIVDWGHIYRVFSGTGLIKSNKATFAAIGEVLEHLHYASDSRYISHSTYLDWKVQITDLLKLDQMSMLTYIDMRFAEPTDLTLLYWMFFHFHGQVKYLGRILILCFSLLRQTSSDDFYEMLERFHFELDQSVLHAACMASFEQSFECHSSLIATVTVYVVTTDHTKSEQEIVLGAVVSKYLCNILLNDARSHLPGHFKILYEDLNSVYRCLNEPLLHELLYQQILEALSAARNRMDFVAADFSGYVDYVQSRRLVGAACINKLKSLL